MDFFDGIGARKIWTFAAAAAFYLFLSLVPILGLVCSVLPYTPLTEATFLAFLQRFAPEELYSVLSGIIVSIYDAAHDISRKENFVVFRLRACFFMVIALAAVLMTLCGIVYGGRILDLVSRHLTGSWAEDVLLAIIRIGRYPVMMLILFLVFLIMYKWMPAGKRRLMRQWPGALFTTVAWLVFSWGFSLYVSYSDRYGVYGILGTVIVALLWIYYCLFILLVGAYINRFVREEPERLRTRHPELQPTNTPTLPDPPAPAKEETKPTPTEQNKADA